MSLDVAENLNLLDRASLSTTWHLFASPNNNLLELYVIFQIYSCACTHHTLRACSERSEKRAMYIYLDVQSESTVQLRLQHLRSPAEDVLIDTLRRRGNARAGLWVWTTIISGISMSCRGSL
jgi:hypothetical protein